MTRPRLFILTLGLFAVFALFALSATQVEAQSIQTDSAVTVAIEDSGEIDSGADEVAAVQGADAAIIYLSMADLRRLVSLGVLVAIAAVMVFSVKGLEARHEIIED